MQDATCAEAIDVAVVGSGPAGLGAGLYAARAGLSTVVFGDRYQSQLARAEIVENYPTQIEPKSGVEMIELFAKHAAKFGAQFDDQEVLTIRREGDRFSLYTSGSCRSAYAVILAMGTKRQRLGVPGEEQYYGQGVAYCTICDGPLFRGRPVAVIGSGEEGAAAAMRMSSIASSVDFLVPEPDLGSGEALLDQLEATSNVTIITGVEIEEIQGGTSGVTGVRFRRDGDEDVREVQGVFLELGLLPASTLAADLGVELTGDQFIRVHTAQETNVAGVFAAGDITGHRARQSVISAGEGATAAVSAVDYIKAHGLGGDRKSLRLIQWGTRGKPATRETGPTFSLIGEALQPAENALMAYVKGDPAYQQMYGEYQPDAQILDKVRERQPKARVTVVAESRCPDCRRNVPQLARISEHLPRWEFSVITRESDEAGALGVQKIPTFVIFDPDTGTELGRVIENPKADSIEQDLLEIVSSGQAGGAFTEV